METNNSKIKKDRIVFSIVIIAIVVISVIGVLFANGMFNLKGRKFINLLTKEQYLLEMIEVCKDEFDDSVESNYVMEVRNSPLKQLQSFLNLEEYNLINGDIELSANVVIDKEDIDSKIMLKPQTDENQNIEFISEKDKFAISIPSLFEKFVVIENRNVEESLKKLFNISGENNDSSKQIKKFLKKYSNIVAVSINDYIEKNDKSLISINDEEYKTEQYVLSLDAKSFNKIYLNMLNELKNDDESISFITNKINEIGSFRNEFMNEKNEKIKNEDLKENIEDLYNEINLKENSLTESGEILKISLYDYEDKNIKTEIEFLENKILLETTKKEKKDYINIIFGIKGEELTLKYIGEKNDDSYSGKINIISGNNPLLGKVNIEKVINSKAKVRKIEELEKVILSEASSEELKKLREEIKKNLKVDNTQIPDFVVNEPKTDADVIENSRLAYTRINPIMTTDEVIKIMGEPAKIESGDDDTSQYLYWNQSGDIELISVKVKGIKLYNVYNNIALGTQYDSQLSKELGGEIEDLNSLVSNISIENSKDEVINILGEKYIEVSKSNLGYIRYKWYDKNENNIEIEFNENNKVVNIGKVL